MGGLWDNNRQSLRHLHRCVSVLHTSRPLLGPAHSSGALRGSESRKHSLFFNTPDNGVDPLHHANAHNMETQNDEKTKDGDYISFHNRPFVRGRRV